MNPITRKRQDRIFNDWRNKVKIRLPDIVTRFYQIEGYIDYSIHINMGKVISYINSPYYTVLNDRGDRLTDIEIISRECILRIITEDLFKFVNTHTKHETNK